MGAVLDCSSDLARFPANLDGTASKSVADFSVLCYEMPHKEEALSQGIGHL
jgi:hypothetical protein